MRYHYQSRKAEWTIRQGFPTAVFWYVRYFKLYFLCNISFSHRPKSVLTFYAAFVTILNFLAAGFDVDFCQAVAAAIFNGDPSKVQYIILNEEDAFKALATNQVDVLSRASAEYEKDVKDRDTGVGYAFTQPHFYGGMAVGGIPP